MMSVPGRSQRHIPATRFRARKAYSAELRAQPVAIGYHAGRFRPWFFFASLPPQESGSRIRCASILLATPAAPTRSSMIRPAGHRACRPAPAPRSRLWNHGYLGIRPADTCRDGLGKPPSASKKALADQVCWRSRDAVRRRARPRTTIPSGFLLNTYTAETGLRSTMAANWHRFSK